MTLISCSVPEFPASLPPGHPLPPELKVRNVELKVRLVELKVRIVELKVRIVELKVKIVELKVRIVELKVRIVEHITVIPSSGNQWRPLRGQTVIMCKPYFVT